MQGGEREEQGLGPLPVVGGPDDDLEPCWLRPRWPASVATGYLLGAKEGTGQGEREEGAGEGGAGGGEGGCVWGLASVRGGGGAVSSAAERHRVAGRGGGAAGAGQSRPGSPGRSW